MGSLLSRLGIGAATVDTALDQETVEPGDSLDVQVEIEGGSTDQAVESLELAVMTRFRREHGDGNSYPTEALVEKTVAEDFTIEAGDTRTVDAGQIDLPETTPTTLCASRVWVSTELDVDWAVDPTDTVQLDVQPGPYLWTLLAAAEDLGLARRHVENVASSRAGPREFVQELEYRPHRGRYVGELDELELVPLRRGDGLTVGVEVDRRGITMFDLDESHHTLAVESTDTDRVRQHLATLIDDQV